MNDWPVFFALMGTVFLLLLGAIACGVRVRKHWFAVVGLVFCLSGVALICYGLSVQCDGVAVFYRCD